MMQNMKVADNDAIRKRMEQGILCNYSNFIDKSEQNARFYLSIKFCLLAVLAKTFMYCVLEDFSYDEIFLCDLLH